MDEQKKIPICSNSALVIATSNIFSFQKGITKNNSRMWAMQNNSNPRDWHDHRNSQIFANPIARGL